MKTEEESGRLAMQVKARGRREGATDLKGVRSNHVAPVDAPTRVCLQWRRLGRRATELTALLLLCSAMRISVCGQSVSNLTLTAAAGEQQTLVGMGATEGAPGNYSRLPLDSRLDMAKMIWGRDGLGFRVCKLWADPRWAASGPQMLSSYKRLYDDINSVQPNMIWVFGPNGYRAVGHPAREGLEAYAAHEAQMIAYCKANGMVFQFTTTCNEPNGVTPYLYWPTNAAALVKDFRRELDTRGLQEVKIISPECPNVDREGLSYIQNIKDDPIALAGLAAFAVHSANMSLTPACYDLCNVPGKELWQTEGDANGPEGPGPHGANGEQLAAYFAAHACNDLNFGANVWLHFIGYDGYDPRDNATRIMGYDQITGEHQPFLVYYYYKQMRRAFHDGCVLRRSTSSDTRKPVYQQMCFTYGDKPAIIGAAGRNPNGSWGLNVVNLTGEPNSGRNPPSYPGSAVYRPAATYHITYHVAELANRRGDPFRFELYRSSSAVQDADEGAVFMSNGDVTFTIAPMELVTLVSIP